MLSNAFKVFAQLLYKLHALIAAGEGDRPLADDIRDQMDRPWHALPSHEQSIARVLSADLYDLRTEPAEAQKPSSEEDRQLLSALSEAAQRQDWQYVLENIRGVREFMRPSFAAYIRGRAWADLGDADTAWLFFDRASQLDPGDMNFQFIALDTLSKSTRTEDAEQMAKTILDNQEHYHPKLVAKAADIQFTLTRGLTDDAAVDAYRRLIAVYDPLVLRLRDPSGDAPLILVEALVLKGMCHEHLGQRAAARDCYDQALRIDPYNEAALTARGLLLYGQDEQALADLQAACDQNTPLAWPYLFLAHHFLTVGDYGRCAHYCTVGLSRSPTTRAEADLFEWRAISQHELGAPPEQVRALFRKAIQLAPANDRIRSNFILFERLVARATTVAGWSLQPEEETRQIGREEFMFRAVA